MKYRKTAEAARELGISYSRLFNLMRYGERIDPLPERDSSGDYIWTDADMQRAREALKMPRKRKAVPVAV